MDSKIVVEIMSLVEYFAYHVTHTMYREAAEDKKSILSIVRKLDKMIREETLEEAANICEANARELVFDDHAQGCRDCAYDIRNFKDNS